jgi:hypothetical protein
MAQTVELLRDIPLDNEDVNRETLEMVIFLAVEIAREGDGGWARCLWWAS